ncbi:hypothetical protein PRIPAC_75706 [Pristionchus pacificus]|uniref:Uncharacterized protein n=1 Tax=Pristionchus pacificus TaxID=54126 RepID=A0A2A6BEM6_PRIPA|nr:hypothetical protein PRIPAC_75706 [Pristionchus pacificus]|eukprot:PDM64332.1 hypothetical protein PRIPAC_52588 [Pristionchus pacificus]
MRQMSTTSPPFDQNDKKYFHFFGKLHVTKAARIVSVCYVVLISIQLIFSITRSLTAAFFSLVSAAFSIVVFGALVYGVFKEKRLYVALSLIITALSLFIFIIAIAVDSTTVVSLAEDFWSVDPRVSQEQFNRDMTTFTVLFIIFICISGFVQAYFLEIVYSFYHFLKDRETSFNFTFDATVSYGASDVFATVDTTTPPAYDHLEFK